MSWQARYVVVDGWWAEKETPSNVDPDYHYDQLQVACLAADKMIHSGAFGEPKGSFDVTLTGHGNPGHVPLAGWSDDFVSINIAQRRED